MNVFVTGGEFQHSKLTSIPTTLSLVYLLLVPASMASPLLHAMIFIRGADTISFDSIFEINIFYDERPYIVTQTIGM